MSWTPNPGQRDKWQAASQRAIAQGASYATKSRNRSPAFKAKVALAAIKNERTLTELPQQFDVRANQITQWKRQLIEGASATFDHGSSAADSQVHVAELHAKIGADHALPIVRQCALLQVASSTAYYRPQPPLEADLALIKLIDTIPTSRTAVSR